MILRYAGDTHGRIDELKSMVSSAADAGITTMIQVGDFGVFTPDDCPLYKWIKERAESAWTVKIITSFGNHDNWNLYYELCARYPDEDLLEIYPGSGVYVVRRGSVIEIEGVKHLFLGGALSNDRQNRVEEVSWWDREEPSEEEFQRFFDSWEAHKPDTIVTHDAPLRVPFNRAGRNSNTTVRMLDHALKLSDHKPKKWYFGHHHKLKKWKIGGIRFHCCGLHGQYWDREIRV